MIPQVCTGESHPVLQRLITETFTGDDNPPFNDEIEFLFNFKLFKSLFFIIVNFKLVYSYKSMNNRAKRKIISVIIYKLRLHKY